MSLDIFFNYPQTDWSEWQNWNIGTEFKLQGDCDNVEIVQASGQELDHIKNRFINLPVARGNFCCWYGDFARFIAGNL